MIRLLEQPDHNRQTKLRGFYVNTTNRTASGFTCQRLGNVCSGHERRRMERVSLVVELSARLLDVLGGLGGRNAPLYMPWIGHGRRNAPEAPQRSEDVKSVTA